MTRKNADADADASDLRVVPIGVVRSPFVDKFGVPRQAGRVKVPVRIELDPAVVEPVALRGLEAVSHVWVVWLFHRHVGAPPQPTVRPPRLGGNERLGVFATRSPFRPNPIGLSAVKLLGIDGLALEVEGLDAVDGTPVLDVKPYVAEVDSLPDARVDWMAPELPPLPVVITAAADAALASHPQGAMLRELVVGMLQADPRPGYRRGEADGRVHGMAVLDVDVRFEIADDVARVLEVRPSRRVDE